MEREEAAWLHMDAIWCQAAIQGYENGGGTWVRSSRCGFLSSSMGFGHDPEWSITP